MLLEKNADFTAADGNGATALHYVAQSNFSETVAVFLSFDKIKDMPDKDGRTALMWAAGKGLYKCPTSDASTSSINFRYNYGLCLLVNNDLSLNFTRK